MPEHMYNNPNEYLNYNISDEEFKILDTTSIEIDLLINKRVRSYKKMKILNGLCIYF